MVRDHLFKHLGSPANEFKSDLEASLSIICFDNVPFPHVTTYVTCGLSAVKLVQPEGPEIRQELLISAYSSFSRVGLMSLLINLSEKIAQSSEAISQGMAIRQGNPIIPGANVTGIFTAPARSFGESFYMISTLPCPVIIVDLVPMVSKDFEMHSRLGPKGFSKMVSANRSVFWNLDR